MDIRIHPEFLERLSQISWFSRVFEPEEISTFVSHRYVKSWDEARPLFQDIEWEMTRLEARNAFSSHVGMKYPEIFNTTWNELVMEAKPFIVAQVVPMTEEMMKRHNLGKTFIHRVKWDVLNIIMEDVYRDTNAPIRFYSELLKFYEAGHFPCGWTHGRWPKGRLVVA